MACSIARQASEDMNIESSALRLTFFACVLCLAITGCASPVDRSGGAPEPSPDPVGTVLEATEAIRLAAEAAPQGVEGVFAITVRAVGSQGDRVYLNSELDYRDPRCLTIALTPTAATTLRDRLGPDLRAALIGREIRVRGRAERKTIHFTANGVPTGKYYFQIHVDVDNVAQITLMQPV
jgi:hypothetical protein